MPDLVAVSLANVVVPVGIGQDAVAVALKRSDETLPAYVAELQRRRDALIQELQGLPVGVPGGGWSMLLRLSISHRWKNHGERLLERDVCATAMAGWGETHGVQYIRFVFSNEPAPRFGGFGRRVRAALKIS